MNYSSNILITAIECTWIGIVSVVADAGVWGEEAKMTDGNPAIIKMATTYTPCYLSRDNNKNGTFGRFRFGEKLNLIPGKCVSAVDDGRQSFFIEYKMGDREYRSFRNAKLFFDKERQRLYKIVAEQIFSHDSLARDRMKIVKGTIDDCKQGYGLSLVRNIFAENRIVYEGSDEIIMITLEMRNRADGKKHLVFTIVNKKMKNGEDDSKIPVDITDGSDCVEVQI